MKHLILLVGLAFLSGAQAQADVITAAEQIVFKEVVLTAPQAGLIRARADQFTQVRALRINRFVHFFVWEELTPLVPLLGEISTKARELGGSNLQSFEAESGYLLGFQNLAVAEASRERLEKVTRDQEKINAMGANREALDIHYTLTYLERIVWEKYPVNQIYCKKEIVPEFSFSIEDRQELFSGLNFKVSFPATALVKESIQPTLQDYLSELANTSMN